MKDSVKGSLSLYANRQIVLPSKHQKAQALAKPFREVLGANLLEWDVDTDSLGTFCGEIERTGSMSDTAKRKCALAFDGTEVDYAIASEGSFGSHPLMGSMAINEEMLYFIDRTRNLHVIQKEVFYKTNYAMQKVSSIEALHRFADKALFPSHGLILRPSPRQSAGSIFKGIRALVDLEAAFFELQRFSGKKSVQVETDMRAHMNPTRMQNIAELGVVLANKLNSLCPDCQNPGWGRIKFNTGLPCSWCHTPTHEVKSVTYGCVKCDYQEEKPTEKGNGLADPGNCPYCNP
ncbi:DUF6671 family protein [Thiomicrorhabdus sediminis]|uniref:DUF6671 domain-containing protein n=1 Tax=Thiomicrorhabdus sediminis TaxID=2580412 RepID=A0A4P9K8Y7_9GAMM|nr:DUF6671 family protein [Thiomicrorhabdus sediminis]QCU90886.1 hypothetical protein FE785_09725 [Thiomicrorhabdus sediminis]